MTGIICAMQIEANGIIALSQNTQTEEIAGMKFTSRSRLTKNWTNCPSLL